MFFKKFRNGTQEQSLGPGLVTAPFTDIQNRAPVNANMKAVGPVERIHFNSFMLLPKENGADGKRVWTTEKNDSRIRFVGEYRMVYEASGHLISLGDADKDPYIEITFYGTGLNILYAQNSALTRDQLVTIDGVDQGLINFGGISGIISQRNYAPRIPRNIANNLTEGWHTIRLTNKSTSSFYAQGVEILNEVENQIKVFPGSVYKDGAEYILDAEKVFELKPSTLVAPNGARAYLTMNPATGEVEQSFRIVPVQVPGSTTNLVTNGTFDTDLSGWQNLARASWHPSQRLLIDATTGSGARQAEQEITSFSIGTTYRFAADFENIANTGGGSTAQIAVYTATNFGGTLVAQRAVNAATGNISVTFEAPATTLYIVITLSDNGDAAYFDNVTVVKFAPQGKFLTNADHSEEAIAYEVESRDFGRDRTDDFRTLGGSGSNRAFNMETGDFGLSCINCVHGDPDGRILFPNTTGSSYTIHFMGTGIDLIRQDNANVTSSQVNSVEVDGELVGQLDSNGSTGIRLEKIASNLPYGPHTVKITLQNTAAYSPGLKRFRVYQPKKPAVAEGSVEIASYSIPADFEKPPEDLTGGELTMPVGTVSMTPDRGFEYRGSWSTVSTSPAQMKFGLQADTNSNGAQFKFNFLGTGFVHFWTGETNNSSQIFIRVNGQLLTDTNFPTVTKTYNTNGQGGGFFPLEGRINQGTSIGNVKGCWFSVENLPHGVYEVEFTLNNSAFMRNAGVSIIAPAHAIDFTTGRNSLQDLREQMPVITEALVEDRNQRVYNLKNVNQVLEVGVGFYIIWFESPFVTGRKNYAIGVQRGDKKVVALGTSPYLSNTIFQTTASNGSQETNIEFNVSIKGEVQKDIFKD